MDTNKHHWVQAGTHRQEGQQIEGSPVLSESCGEECLDKSTTVCSTGLDSRRGTLAAVVLFKWANVRTALHGKKWTAWVTLNYLYLKCLSLDLGQ